MKILVDMNLSPEWVEVFRRDGWEAEHWSSVGDPRAQDVVVFDWARLNGFTIFTHDLDFGTLLAMTRARGPSVVQIRSQNVFPEASSVSVTAALMKYGNMLETGAILSIDEGASRVRVLPISN